MANIYKKKNIGPASDQYQHSLDIGQDQWTQVLIVIEGKDGKEHPVALFVGPYAKMNANSYYTQLIRQELKNG